jgi:hypothetical protein
MNTAKHYPIMNLADRRIYSDWCPTTDRKRPEFSYDDFQSLDAPRRIPYGASWLHQGRNSHTYECCYVTAR